MEKNIFEGAKFGDIFLTKNGRKAIYFSHTINAHVLIIEDIAAFFQYYDNGEIYEHCLSELARTQEHINIVSKYTELVDENELNNMAKNEFPLYIDETSPLLDQQASVTVRDYINIQRNAFKLGYKKRK